MFNLNYGSSLYPLMAAAPCKPKAQRENAEQYIDTFNNLVDIFLNLFEWKGLPDTCNARALEQVLLFDGKCLFFKHHDNGGFYNCPFNFDGNTLNFYGEFTSYQTNAPTYQGHEYNETNAVVIRNTPTMFPSWFTLDIFARKLYDNARALDVYQTTMKRPFLISGSKEMKVTIETILKGTAENEYFFVLNKTNMKPTDFQFMPIPTNPENMYALWDNLHNNQGEILKRMGIRYAGIDKAERLVAKEASGSDNITEANGDMLLDARLLACEQINNLFGLSVSCDYKHDYNIEQDEITTNNENGGEQFEG